VELEEYRLIGEHSYFEILEQSDFPPLYDVRDFETWWEDFLAIAKELTGDEMPGQSFKSLGLYVVRWNQVQPTTFFHTINTSGFPCFT
jgi:hypothetical protein